MEDDKQDKLSDLFLKFLELNYAKSLTIMQMKNRDYADADDPFKNFRGALDVGVPVERGIMIRLTDKVSRISNLLKSNENHVKTETVSDTLLDLMGYANLLLTYLQWEGGEKAVQSNSAPAETPEETSLLPEDSQG